MRLVDRKSYREARWITFQVPQVLPHWGDNLWVRGLRETTEERRLVSGRTAAH